MCWQIALAALGAGAQAVDRNQQAKIADQALQERIRASTTANQAAGQRVAEETQRVAADTGDAERAQLNNDFMTALRQAQPAGGGPTGAVSDRFAAGSAEAAGAQAAETKKLAGNLARVDAPILQRANQAQHFNNTATDLDLIKSRLSGQDFLAQLRAASLGGPSGLGQAGQFLTAYGQAAAQRAPRGKLPNATMAAGAPDYYGAPV